MSSSKKLKEIFVDKDKLFYNFGLISFQIGILLLASAPAISITLLIFSSVCASLNRVENYFLDKYNYPFLIASILMIINCILITINNSNLTQSEVSNSWIGLSNWLPFFWCFWSFQRYLYKEKLRLNTAKLLIIGTLPVLISCFCQYFLKMYGPYRFLNNLVVWYQRPLGNENGVTGLFNNQNYAGAWLCIILPLCIIFLVKNYKNLLIKFLTFLLSINIVYMIILTSSRNAILSIFVTILLITKSIKTKLITIFSLISIPLILNLIPAFSQNFQNFINRFIPFELVKKASLNNLSNLEISPRLEIWDKAIYLIKANLMTGYGAGSFSNRYSLVGGNHEGIQHTHNIFLEITFSHGLLPGLILIFMMIYLIINSWKSYKNKIRNISSNQKIEFYNFDRAWIISFIIFFLIHLSDITYFDGRISILSWILLSGMNSIIKENYKLKNN